MSPSKLLAQYESFLVQNASTINTVESSLRSLTWFLPGRFKDAELASESLSATLNLLGIYHDTLIARQMTDTKSKAVIPPTPHSKYIKAWMEKDWRYKWAARTLEIIRYVELVVEMSLRRKLGNKGVWRGIITLESMKAILRLLIVKITTRPFLSPPMPEREVDPATMPQNATIDPSPIAETPDHIKNNRLPTFATKPNPLLSPLPAPGQTAPPPIENYLMGKALDTSAVRAPIALQSPMTSPKDWIAEILYILRPLIYVIMLSRTKRGNGNSTSPLLISLSIELITRYIRRTPPASATLERSEQARRDRDLLWYFLRGFIWDDYTRPKLQSFANRTKSAPILSLFSSLVNDWIPLIDEYHYCA